MARAGNHLLQRCVPRALLSRFSLLPATPKTISASASVSSKATSFPAIQAPSTNPLYPYSYTTGRWLHRDEEQRAARRINFNFEALCGKILALSPEAAYIVSYEKREGGYNKVFIFLLNNGKRLVARLPTRVAGPSGLTTNSEVATMTYVKANTTIPVPDILDWSDDSKNSIGSEYIIMNHVEGVQLQQRWPSMSGSQYTKCVQSICMTMKQLAALKFPAYGSLYFSNAPFDTQSKRQFGGGFCIGPHCGTSYWDSNAGQQSTNPPAPLPGPWSDLSSYAYGLVQNGYSRLPPVDTGYPRPSYFGTVEEHQNLISSAQDVIQNLILQPQIRNSAEPTLFHADLNARNIYVSEDDPTKITGLIDWQSSSIEPIFIYANEMPDVAAPPNQPPADIPEDEARPLTEQDKKLAKIATFCNQAYNICVDGYIPKLRVARSVDQHLIRPFQYCNTSWRDSAPALRQEFLDLAEQWETLGLSGSCPYKPGSDELALHHREYRAFNHVQELKTTLMDLLGTDSDGWVPAERWDEVKDAHKEVFAMALDTAREGDPDIDDPLTEEEVRELWPFDRIWRS